MAPPPHVVLSASASAWAASPSPDVRNAQVQRLIEELTGQAPPATRTAAEWESACGQVIDALMSAKEYPLPGRKRTSGMVILDQIVRRALNPEKAGQRAGLLRAFLIRLEKSRDLNQRVYCLRELAVLGTDESVDVLARLLADADSTVRQYALGALESNPSPGAGRALAAALHNSRDAAWRIAIIQALGRRRQPSAEQVLRELAGDPQEGVAAAAELALANLGSPPASPGPPKPSARQGQELASARIHAALLRAERLVEQGELATARTLYLQVFQTAGASHLRCGALSGLVRCGPEQAVPQLLEALAGSDMVLQAHAARLAGLLKGKEATGRLRAALPRLPARAQELLSETLSASP